MAAMIPPLWKRVMNPRVARNGGATTIPTSRTGTPTTRGSTRLRARKRPARTPHPAAPSRRDPTAPAPSSPALSDWAAGGPRPSPSSPPCAPIAFASRSIRAHQRLGQRLVITERMGGFQLGPEVLERAEELFPDARCQQRPARQALQGQPGGQRHKRALQPPAPSPCRPNARQTAPAPRHRRSTAAGRPAPIPAATGSRQRPRGDHPPVARNRYAHPPRSATGHGPAPRSGTRHRAGSPAPPQRAAARAPSARSLATHVGRRPPAAAPRRRSDPRDAHAPRPAPAPPATRHARG